MIKLDEKFQTVVRNYSNFNGSVSDVTVMTDTLFISDVGIDFTTGILRATIQKGTNPPFQPNLDSTVITVNPDGSFTSSDGSWSGSSPAVVALVAQLKAAFDGFILMSGLVTGTII